MVFATIVHKSDEAMKHSDMEIHMRFLQSVIVPFYPWFYGFATSIVLEASR